MKARNSGLIMYAMTIPSKITSPEVKDLGWPGIPFVAFQVHQQANMQIEKSCMSSGFNSYSNHISFKDIL